jgi:hypothetical protein
MYHLGKEVLTMDSDILNQVEGKKVVVCEYMANLLVNIPSKNAKLTAECPSIHVGASPKEESGLAYKRAFMALMKEKILNEMQSWNQIADRMRADDLFSDSATVSWDELIAFVSTMEGQVIPPSAN